MKKVKFNILCSKTLMSNFPFFVKFVLNTIKLKLRADPWDGVLDGTAVGNQPMQAVEEFVDMYRYVVSVNEFGEDYRATSEDCLYLDVYTSVLDRSTRLPVSF